MIDFWMKSMLNIENKTWYIKHPNDTIMKMLSVDDWSLEENPLSK